MTVLIVADHRDAGLADDVAKVVTAALKIGGDVHVLVAGKNLSEVASAAAKLKGVSKVRVADSEPFQYQLAEPIAELIVKLAPQYDAVLSAASTYGKTILPRVAALLDVMQISEIIEVVSSDTFKRPIYAGNAIQTVRSNDVKKVITVRTTAFDAVTLDGDAELEQLDISVGSQPTTFVNSNLASSNRPGLASARIVVAGGRAMGSSDKFSAVLSPLADKLGAALGASRAAVDAGYAPNDWQVGQTGKIVAPELYIACGISGAIQHLAGMTGSKVIVAINKDEDAPIFQVADYGLVGDLFELLPELEKAI
jgi:electron transfer flavoprotein alpha subunit